MHGERLLNVGVGTYVHTFHLRVIIGLGGEHHERDVTRQLVAAHPSAQFDSIHPRHHPIADEDVNLVLLQLVKCLDAVACCDDLILLTEVVLQEFAHILGVFDDEHGLFLR